MASANKQRAPTSLTSNVYVLEQSKSDKIQSIPGDMLSDLVDAFNFYDKDQLGVITETHFKNILHNFGFHRLPHRESEDELKKADGEWSKRSGFTFEFTKMVVATRWNKDGATAEATECFKLFDKRDRGFINSQDLKTVLADYLEFPVTEVDINDFMNETDKNGTG